MTLSGVPGTAIVGDTFTARPGAAAVVAATPSGDRHRLYGGTFRRLRGSVLHVSGGCSVTATRAADSDYNEATSAASAISSISKGTQAAVTLSGVPARPSLATPSPPWPGAAVVVAATPPWWTGTACCVDFSTGAGSVLHVSGGCSVTATRAADSDYNEATSAASAISSISKGTQAAVTLSGVPGTATVATPSPPWPGAAAVAAATPTR